MKPGYVYMLANHHRTLYIGVTNNIESRLRQHRTTDGNSNSFSKRYGLTKLVYLEECPDMSSAIEREKQLKRWRREKKVALIEKINPHWLDLSPMEK